MFSACHPERREGSIAQEHEILSETKDDNRGE